ncbi:DUF1836 domain-containing protein [Lacticaseibacillus brantae]|uniref:BS ykrK family protein n=1 Tax=Lacticaseibacillus brantae DSM 23927 TaxID=1423727 RepID=A0A0R2B8X4_9LACO|nr:DUF1836 domain-containing protein [Lacticaseibacillus brantae]KRM72582.1 BS ykrK family protein [Lacticaseibacillus brantae DSM 23927]
MATTDPLTTYLDQIRQAKLPRWTDLPQFDLYMDQVVQYVNEILHPFGVGDLTATMVNNYVKKGVVKPPLKKKYERAQIANVLVIALLKPVFALDTIASGIDYQLQNRPANQAFDAFIMAFISGVQQANTDFSKEVTINAVNKTDLLNIQSAMVTLAINAVLEKLFVESMVTQVAPAPTAKKKKD